MFSKFFELCSTVLRIRTCLRYILVFKYCSFSLNSKISSKAIPVGKAAMSLKQIQYYSPLPAKSLNVTTKPN